GRIERIAERPGLADAKPTIAEELLRPVGELFVAADVDQLGIGEEPLHGSMFVEKAAKAVFLAHRIVEDFALADPPDARDPAPERNEPDPIAAIAEVIRAEKARRVSNAGAPCLPLRSLLGQIVEMRHVLVPRPNGGERMILFGTQIESARDEACSSRRVDEKT